MQVLGKDGEVHVQSNTGHACTPDKLKRVANWVWRWVLSSENPNGTMEEDRSRL